MTEIQEGRERTGRHSHSKGVVKQVIQTWSVMGEAFDLESRYKVIDYLGAGAYGVVCAAQDSSENNVVAIKKCKKIFQSRTLAKRTLRELRLLRLFDHENVVKIKSVLKPLDAETFSEIYVVFEIMETDLAQIIRSPQTLKDQHVQYFTYQLLLALKYLHTANIVHRDLKPRNLLVNGDCCLKVADFGLARVYNDSNDSKILAMTEYVTTRWYRAPEVLVGWHRYTSAVDMWAVGCIVAELIGRMPLFPGADSMKQLDLLCRFSGKPSDEFIRQSRKASCRQYLNELPSHIKATDVRNLYPGANPQALDLVKRLLDFNPVTRITAEEALQHPYIQPMLLRNPTARVEPVLLFSDSEFLFEGQKASVDDLRAELLREVNSYLPKTPAKSRGTFLVVSDVDAPADGGVLASLTASALKAAQEKEKAVVVAADVEGAKDKHQAQYQSSGQTSTEAGVNSYNSTNIIGNSSTTSLLTSAAVLMVTPSEPVASKNGNGSTDLEQENVRGNKRGRMETPAAPHVNNAVKEKSGAIPFGSSSSFSSDVSVMSDRMKALSTSATTAVIDRSSVAVAAIVQSLVESQGDVPLYVRRGAKRASLAAERPAAGGEIVNAAVSKLDDAEEEEEEEEEEGWGKREASVNKEVKSDLVVVGAPFGVTTENSTYTKPNIKAITADKQRGGGSLYLCLGRENGLENADDSETAVVEEGDEADGTCNFKTGKKAARRQRAAKRAMSSSLTQKSDPCVIL